jgi:hypothetical protein
MRFDDHFEGDIVIVLTNDLFDAAIAFGSYSGLFVMGTEWNEITVTGIETAAREIGADFIIL